MIGAVAVAVDPLEFLVQVVAVVLVEVAVADQRPEGEDRFGSCRPPAGPGEIHPVLHDVAACSFYDPGGDRPAAAQRGGVVQAGLFRGEVARAGIRAFAFGSRVAVGAGTAAATCPDLPARILRAWPATHTSASGSPGSKKLQAARQQYSST